jgi:hypothetical protein
MKYVPIENKKLLNKRETEISKDNSSLLSLEGSTHPTCKF